MTYVILALEKDQGKVRKTLRLLVYFGGTGNGYARCNNLNSVCCFSSAPDARPLLLILLAFTVFSPDTCIDATDYLPC